MRPLLEVLRALGSPRVLVVGDVMLDTWIRGTVDRVSPEAPIGVLSVEEEESQPGGAAFAALCASALGARCVLLGAIGPDDSGRLLSERLRSAGVDFRPVVDPSRPTTVKTRHVARRHSLAQQMLRVDREVCAPLSQEGADGLRRAITGCAAEADIVLVNDYGKGCLDPALLAEVYRIARARRLRVVVDPQKGADFARYRGASVITPNRAETEGATGILVRDLGQATHAAQRLLEMLDLEMALVTLDRDGLVLAEAGGQIHHVPTTPREVFDVTGAGDVVLSTFGVALASGASPHEAAALANLAAGLEVERAGVVPIDGDAMAARLAATGQETSAKIVEASAAAALAARWRMGGRRIVFTNGCFDLLHAGHVRYLSEAKSLGDLLVVGLNTDAGVRRLKGGDRPWTPLRDRAAVLAALAAVDLVVPFDEDTPERLIDLLAPDVLVKGSDWKEKGVAGRALVEGRGGRVVLLDLLEGRSTTALARRIRRQEGEP